VRLIRLFAIVFTLSALSFAGVSVSSPYNGSSSGSPVHFVASASGNGSIVAMMVYVDNNPAYTTYSGSLNSYVNMGAGSHYVVVQAWDQYGGVYKAAPMTVKVSGGSGTPSNATTYWNVNQMNGWQWCDKCAGAGGSGPTATLSLTQYEGTPALDGKSAEFWMHGSQPYASALWWRQLGANNNASHFVYDLYFYVKNTSAVQALEFDVNQSIGGHKYIFGTQCDALGHHDWDVWDTANKRWVQTGIYCAPPAAYTWHHVVLEFQRVNGQAKFVAVTLDGNKSYINKAFWPEAVGVQELNTAFQMDGNGSNTAYSTWLDKVNLSVW
jgi:hypothetical protein